MKLCKKCGAVQADKILFCLDCGASLGDPVDAKTEARINAETRKGVDKMASDGDFLALKPMHKVCGIAMLAMAVSAGIFFLFPKFSGEARPVFGLVFLIGVFFGIHALTPKFCWLIEKLRLSFRVDNTDNLIPSAGYIIVRKLTIYVSAVFVLAMYAFAVYAALRLNFFPI